jgi:hypothetical protein
MAAFLITSQFNYFTKRILNHIALASNYSVMKLCQITWFAQHLVYFA